MLRTTTNLMGQLEVAGAIQSDIILSHMHSHLFRRSLIANSQFTNPDDKFKIKFRTLRSEHYVLASSNSFTSEFLWKLIKPCGQFLVYSNSIITAIL